MERTSVGSATHGLRICKLNGASRYPHPKRTAYNRDRTSHAEENYAAVWRSYSLDELY